MSTPALRRAERALVACIGFRGHDFNMVLRSSGPLGRGRAKRITNKAARRHGKALAREDA